MNKRPILTRLACTATLAASLIAGAALPSVAATAAPAAATHVAAHSSARPATKAAPHKAKAKKTTKKKVVKKKAPAKKAAVANLTSFEAALLADINNARREHGLGALIAAPGYTDVARHWSLQLADDAALSHNPDIVNQIQASGGNSWTWIGENVGEGPAADEPGLFAAYMASPHHRDNILDIHGKYVGIGAIAIDDGQGDQTVYNTCDFSDSYSPSYGADKTPALSNVISLQQAQAALS